MKQKPLRTLVSSFVIGVFTMQPAHAGGFSLYTESSAAALGNFAAGIAAEAADASIGWYNPAGLVLIQDKEVVLSGIGVLPSTSLTGTSTFSTQEVDPYVQSFSNLQGAQNAFVPALHYAKPLGPRATFGFSLVSPFGSSTDWGNTSAVRYAATNTELLLINASPQMGVKLTDHVFFGAGLDLQWARVKFNAVLGSPAELQFLQSIGGLVTPTTLDSLSYNQGSSFGIGAHAGLLATFNDNHTRLGVNYQSKIQHEFNDYSLLTGPLADPQLTNIESTFLSDSLHSNQINMPDVLTLSAYQDINNKLALLASLVYTGWETFRTIELSNIAAYAPELGEQVLVDVVTNEYYRDTWRVALGANYHVTNDWMMRIGGGFDETPTVKQYRDVRLPDANRWAVSIGSHYQMRPRLGFDIGYTYLFGAQDSVINNTQQLGETSTFNVTAKGNVHAHLVGLQAVLKMD